MNEPVAPNKIAPPHWYRRTLIILTVIYLLLGIPSIFFGLLGFMCFDAGVTAQGITEFIIGWLFPIGFFLGIGLAWTGYHLRSTRLAMAGLCLPFIALAIFCTFVTIAVLTGH